MEFYRSLVLRANRDWWNHIVDSRSKLIGFFVQTTVLLGLLYFMPWFGEVAPETRLVGALIAATIASTGLLWLYYLIRAPVVMDAEKEAKIAEYYSIIRDISNAESVLLSLSHLHASGMALYKKFDTPIEWEKKLQSWSDDVCSILKDNFSVGVMHRFKSSSNIGEYRTDWKWAVTELDDNKSLELKMKYSSKFYELDWIIKSGETLYFGPKLKLGSFIEGINSQRQLPSNTATRTPP